MTSMTSRERVLAALSHQEPDRVPLELGGSIVSGITARVYDQIKTLLNIDLGPTRIFGRMNQLAIIDDEILDILGIDTRGVLPGVPSEHEERVIDGTDEFTNVWGLTFRITPEHDTYFLANEPLSGEISFNDIENYPWPNPDDINYTEGLREKILKYRAQDDRAIVISLPYSIVQLSQLLRGFSQWFMDIAIDPKLPLYLIDKVMELQEVIQGNILDRVGDIVDVIFFFDDLAMQDRLIVKPETYTELFEPRLAKHVQFLRSKTDAKIIHHTDGAIVPILGSLADVVGVDGVNPLQVSAVGMDAVVDIKKQFGDRLAFWGGVDTQDTMPYGTPSDVRQETLSRIRDLNQDGGYVLGAVHNIQVDVPGKNVLALFGAALETDFGLDLFKDENTSAPSATAKQEKKPTKPTKAVDQTPKTSTDELDGILIEVYESILNGEKSATVEAVQAALDSGIPVETILNDACIAALDEVGSLFEAGDLFIPEMLIAAQAMKAATELLKPLLVSTDVEKIGKVVIGTVAGDLHDIGKNLVGIMMDGAGFEVIDLGIDVSAEAFVEAVRVHQPAILGMSALLTTTTRSIPKTIDALEEAGLREQLKIMIGGAPITDEFAEKVGADGFALDAGSAARKAKILLGVGP